MKRKTNNHQENSINLAIGTKLDNFCLRDPRILDWSSRRWRVLEEVLQHRPDVITLQEVDHFSFLAPALASVGYCGRCENGHWPQLY